MRRADRLFQIIQVLRRTRKPMTADAIAAELETSKRTIYRDIATLIGQRVPIRGEAGMGYILEKGFDLPPLMLTPDEIEAAVLGAQWVAGHADAVLARAAEDLMAKIADTVPERLRPFVLEPASRARPAWQKEADRIDMVRTRSQIQERRSRCAIATSTAATANAPSGRSPSAISKPCGCWRHGASCAGIFAAFAPTVSSTPAISTKNIRSGVTCSGRSGEGAWSGNRRATPDRCLARPAGRSLHSALNGRHEYERSSHQ
jgi:biotin operon repressor